jgi:hypothetical protein
MGCEAVYLAPPFHFDKKKTYDRKISTYSITLIFIWLKSPVLTLQRTHSAYTRRTKQLVLLPSGEIIRIDCDSLTKQMNMLFRQNTEFLNFRARGIYTYH